MSSENDIESFIQIQKQKLAQEREVLRHQDGNPDSLSNQVQPIARFDKLRNFSIKSRSDEKVPYVGFYFHRENSGVHLLR